MQQQSSNEAATKQSTVLKYYHQFEHLATDYAKKIFESGKIGLEYEDLVQEFKIKIYTSIIAYAARWKRYKREGRYKPVPIEYYVKCALSKRKIDFIKQIKEEKQVTLSVEQDGFDYGLLHTIDSHVVINSKVCKAEVNGVDLLEGLTTLEARCFMLFLRGFTIGKLQKIFKSKFEANTVINKQVEFLQSKKQQLLENQTYHFTSYKINLDGN